MAKAEYNSPPKARLPLCPEEADDSFSFKLTQVSQQAKPLRKASGASPNSPSAFSTFDSFLKEQRVILPE